MKKSIFAALLFIACTSANSANKELNDDNLLLLDVIYSWETLGDGLDCYLVDDDLYIPLLDLTTLLELYDLQITSKQASGKITDNRQFQLVQSNSGWQLNINNEKISIASNAILLSDGLIHIESSLAEQLFELELNLRKSDSKLYLSTESSLPFAERYARKNQNIFGQNYIGEAQNPNLNIPYQGFDLPSLDFQTYHSFRDNLEKEGAKSTHDSSYTLISHGDLAWMSSKIYLNGNRSDGLMNASVTLDRFDHEREMTPLGLSQFSIGDMSHPTLPLAPSSYGRGLIVGNDTVAGDSYQDVSSIEGDFYPGWEVELYSENTLVGYQIIPADGHYKFNDIFLLEGENDFVLVFYGPNGEKETQQKSVFIGANTQDTHKFRYNLSISEPNKKVIDVNNQNETYRDDLNSVFTGRYSFGSQLSLRMGLMNQQVGAQEASITNPGLIESEKESNNFYHLGADTRLLNTSFGVNVSQKNSDDINMLYTVSGQVLGSSYRLTYDDYGSDYFEETGVQNQASISASGRNDLLGYSFRGSYSDRVDYYNHAYELSLSGKIKSTGWSHTLLYEDTSLDIFEDEQLRGSLFVNNSFRPGNSAPINFRLITSYDLLPKEQLTAIGLSTSRIFSNKISSSFDIDHNLLSDVTKFRLGLNWDLPYLRVTPSVSYDTDGSFQAVLQLSASLGKRQGEYGTYYDMSAKRPASNSAIRTRLFEDINTNGRYDSGEPLLSGGVLTAPQARLKGESNEAGIVWIDKMRPWKPVDINYQNNTIDADEMAFGGQPFSITPRPGKLTRIDMPFYRTGDIDGHVYRMPEKFSARGVVVTLINENGEIAKKEVTDSEGYYSFSGVKPGIYTVTTDNAKLVDSNKGKAQITNQGEFINGFNLIVAEKETDTTLPAFEGADAVSPSKPTTTTPSLSELTPPLDDSFIEETQSFSVAAPASLVSQPTLETQNKEEVSQALPAVKPIKAVPPPTEDTGEWAIQVSSHSEIGYAQVMVNKLKAKNYPVFTKKVSTTKGVFTRVYAGPFINDKTAQRSKLGIDSDLNVKSFVTKFNS